MGAIKKGVFKRIGSLILTFHCSDSSIVLVFIILYSNHDATDILRSSEGSAADARTCQPGRCCSRSPVMYRGRRNDLSAATHSLGCHDESLDRSVFTGELKQWGVLATPSDFSDIMEIRCPTEAEDRGRDI